MDNSNRFWTIAFFSFLLVAGIVNAGDILTTTNGGIGAIIGQETPGTSQNQTPETTQNNNNNDQDNDNVNYEKYCTKDSDCVRRSSCCDCGIGDWINKDYYKEVRCIRACECPITLAKGKCIDNVCTGVAVETEYDENNPHQDKEQNQGQEIIEVQKEKHKEFREIISVLKEGTSVVNGTQNYTQEDINLYIKALNEQTKNLKHEIKDKIVENDTEIAEEVVKREIAKHVSEKAKDLHIEVTTSQVIAAIDLEHSQEVVNVVQEINTTIVKKMYIMSQEGLDSGKKSFKQQIIEYIELLKKSIKPKVVVNPKQLASQDMTPEQILNQVYSEQ